MNREQKFNDPESAHRATQDGLQSKIWTCLPCIVESYAPGVQTLVAQPAIQGVTTDAQDNQASVNLPLLVDVPVQFPSAGGVTMTLPIQAGDEVLVHFSSRCYDAWWQSGGVQPQAEFRMHDLSDGFAVPGLRSQPRKLANVSATTAQIRTDDGQNYIQLDPVAGQISFTSPNQVVFNCPAGIKIVGGGVTADGDGVFGGISSDHHTHPGVQTGSGNTGQPQG